MAKHKAVKHRVKHKIEKHVRKKEDNHDKYFISYVPEVKLLEKGHVPAETKMGTEFKGKNKIVVSK